MRTDKNRVSNCVSNSFPCLSVLDAEELINVGMHNIVYGPGAGHARTDRLNAGKPTTEKTI